MDNPVVFLGMIIGVFFVLWLVGGGPTRPISFSGAYITPVTNTGETQVGYGPQLHTTSSITLPGATVSAGVGSSAQSSSSSTLQNTSVSQTQATGPSTQNSNTSPYAGQLTIHRTTVASPDNPNQKYLELTLSSHDTSAITLTNWKLVSKDSNGAVYIRDGENNTVNFTPGESALIVTTFPSSNVHDTIQLLDGNGEVVNILTY